MPYFKKMFQKNVWNSQETETVKQDNQTTVLKKINRSFKYF